MIKLRRIISTFQYISHNIDGFPHSQLVKQACKGGADWVQLRVKGAAYKDWKKIALQAKTVCKKYDARLIINDNVKIANEINADGVHLGKHDMDPVKARQILGENVLIGATANTFEDILSLYKAKIDYIGLGPYRFTLTKKDLYHELGLKGYDEIMKMCVHNKIDIPIIAIGGVRLEDVEKLMKTGIYGIAVSSAINNTKNIVGKTKEFISKLESLEEKQQ